MIKDLTSPYKTVINQKIVSYDVETRSKDIRICTNGTKSEVINKVSNRLEWKLVNENDLWNIIWTDNSFDISMCRKMKRFQRINHFPGMQELCRKNLLARNLEKMQKMHPTLYQFFPKTWIFPADLASAQRYLNKQKYCFFILKPESSACGNGISIINSNQLKDINPYQRMIGQVYIERPLLVDGYKFDLRVYVLITSIDPLRVYVYNEGLMRLATKRYKNPSVRNINDKFMHLTNYSINKHSSTYSEEEDGGSKRTFKIFNRKISEMGCDVTKLWLSIDDLILKTILSAWPTLKHEYKTTFPFHDVIPACFEILGFDIIITHNLVPYLLEVNHSPSLNTDSLVDRKVKYRLIKDTLKLLKVNNLERSRVLREDKRRVFERLSKNISKCALRKSEWKTKIHDSLSSIMNDDKWVENVTWEESNLGNYRQIMPCSEMDKYKALTLDITEPSLFLDTISSSIRKVTENIQQTNHPKLYQKCQKITISHRYAPVNEIKKLIKTNSNFESEIINKREEFKRKKNFAQREKVVMLSGLVATIYKSFDKNSLLNESDRIKYCNLL